MQIGATRTAATSCGSKTPASTTCRRRCPRSSSPPAARRPRLAAELGDDVFATDPDASLIEAWTAAGGDGPRYCEVPTAFAPDVRAGAEAAHARFRFGPLGWKVLAELPDPVAFHQATQFVRVDDMQDAFACGPDVEVHVAAFREFRDAGFDRLALMDGGPDPDAFFGFFQDELGPRLRESA